MTDRTGTEKQGRRGAEGELPGGSGGRIRLADLLVLAVLLAAPGWAGWKLVPPDSALLVCGWFGISSLVTFGLYAWDKRCAKRREWRVPERIIHGFELSGGWPGGISRPAWTTAQIGQGVLSVYVLVHCPDAPVCRDRLVFGLDIVPGRARMADKFDVWLKFSR